MSYQKHSDRKKIERVWSKATWGMSVSGRFGAFMVESVLGRRPGRDQYHLPAGDILLPVSRGVHLPIEIKATQTGEGAQVPIEQLERGFEVVEESGQYCGLVYAFYRYKNKIWHMKKKQAVSGLVRCKTLLDKTKFLFGATKQIAFVDASLLVEITNRNGEGGKFYRKLKSVPGQTKGPVLELKAKFFDSLSGTNGDWTPQALNLKDQGWLQTSGVSILRYDDRVHKAFPNLKNEEEPEFELDIDRTVPLVGILSGQTARALSGGRHCPLRKKLGIGFVRPSKSEDVFDPERIPF